MAFSFTWLICQYLQSCFTGTAAKYRLAIAVLSDGTTEMHLIELAELRDIAWF